ncbi:hypothetical protein IMCC21224_11800 [Puniceibacterium sp. IMCC21224]|nr:hypothetical protein IMCC21224_11800 [Puniceibacterium sp. IMCC21224]
MWLKHSVSLYDLEGGVAFQSLTRVSQTRSRSGKSRCSGEQRSCAPGKRVCKSPTIRSLRRQLDAHQNPWLTALKNLRPIPTIRSPKHDLRPPGTIK